MVSSQLRPELPCIPGEDRRPPATDYKADRTKEHTRQESEPSGGVFGVITTSIRGVDIDVLLKSLSQEYGKDVQRISKYGEQTNAFFVRVDYWVRSNSEQAVLVIVEHNLSTNACRLQCNALAGGVGLLRVDYGSRDEAERDFWTFVEKLALQHGWQLPKYSVAKCTNCGALYSYAGWRILEDGSVVCQNCNKPFVPHEPLEFSTPETDVAAHRRPEKFLA
jgi:hypothetical protein